MRGLILQALISDFTSSTWADFLLLFDTYSGMDLDLKKLPDDASLPKDLPRVDIIHDLSEEQKLSGCGTRKSCIGQEISEKLDYLPYQNVYYANVLKVSRSEP